MTKEKDNKPKLHNVYGKGKHFTIKNEGNTTTIKPWCWESFPMESCLKKEPERKRSGLVSLAFSYSNTYPLIPWGEASFIGQRRWERDERINGEGMRRYPTKVEVSEIHPIRKGLSSTRVSFERLLESSSFSLCTRSGSLYTYAKGVDDALYYGARFADALW